MAVLVTGSAGFIGFHLSKALLEKNEKVIGIDNINDYYSKKLKKDRNSILKKYENYIFYHDDVCNINKLKKIFSENQIEKICHLAAQAGVRYSIENPHAYQKSNIEGFTNILEMGRQYDIKNFVFASSSSVYGGNKKIPYSEKDNVMNPISFYGATKLANELMAYSYHYLYKIPTCGLRFFTVYGPWGRPDMAYFKFTDKIIKGEKIDVYNHGKMKRDFTYIDDIIKGVISSLEKSFNFEIFNLGNNKPENLLKFIEILEKKIGKKANKKMLPMQSGDMENTYADISKSKKLLGFQPKIDIEDGLGKFIEWYKNYYDINL
jgi:UDP-glucuronate 4-epimerase